MKGEGKPETEQGEQEEQEEQGVLHNPAVTRHVQITNLPGKPPPASPPYKARAASINQSVSQGFSESGSQSALRAEGN